MKWLDNIIDSILFQESDDYDDILDDNSVISTANMINVGRNRAAIIAGSRMAQYSAILDKKTCPLCRELDGMYVEVGSADHLEFTPPIHHKCRCIWVYIGREETMPNVNFVRPNQKLVDKHGGLTNTAGKTSNKVPVKPSLKGFNKITKIQKKGNKIVINKNIILYANTSRQLVVGDKISVPDINPISGNIYIPIQKNADGLVSVDMIQIIYVSGNTYYAVPI